MTSFAFEVLKKDPATGARSGLLHTPHGAVSTPCFLPVATQATVKALSPDEVRGMGVEMVLANTYHLYLRPGAETVARLGGLHRFMGWSGPILTDSGGFQVFSLASLSRVSEEGILFRSHLDGSPHLLTPELAIEVQEALGADIIMALDQCPPYSKGPMEQREAMERTHRWAVRCLRHHHREGQALFGIVQGGVFPELRKQSAQFLTGLGFSGFGIGGLSVGEPKKMTWQVLGETLGWLPDEKPRHLLGIGSPEDLVEGVSLGVDLFDSALPTRVARNGALFTRQGRVIIRNAGFREKGRPIEEGCDCYTCRTFSAAYLHHLFRAEELLAYRLATLHNLRFIVRLMGEMRQAILRGDFASLRESFLASYRPADEEIRQEQKKRWLAGRVRRTIPEGGNPYEGPAFP